MNLSYENRKIIEKMLNQGEKIVVIADIIGCHRATIYNELKRGGIPYCADVAQRGVKKCNVQSNIDEIRNKKLEELNSFLEKLKILIDWFNNINIAEKKKLLNDLLELSKLNNK